jgi:hypothetical protein
MFWFLDVYDVEEFEHSFKEGCDYPTTIHPEQVSGVCRDEARADFDDE